MSAGGAGSAGGRPSAVGVWVVAARPRTLGAAVAPVLLGLAIAWGLRGALDVVNAVATLVGAVAIQVGTNFFNDFADSLTGADKGGRLGPPRATSLGWVSGRVMLAATGVAFAVAIVAGLVLIARCGPVFLWIGVASLVCGVWYTAGRWSLAYLGLAEPFVLFFFGPLAVAGTVFAQTGTWEPVAWVAGLGPGALATVLLVLNNLRDRAGDAAAGKRTLVVRLGRRFGLGELGACHALAAGAVLVLLGLVRPEQAGWLGVVYCYAVFSGVALVREAARAEGREFNALMGRAGLRLVVFCVLLGLVFLV